MKKRVEQEAPEGAKMPFPDGNWVKRFPSLCEYLSHMEYDDGSKRELSTVTIREQDGRVLVALNDKDTSATAYISGEDVLGALQALEKALVAGTADWRRWQGGAKKKK